MAATPTLAPQPRRVTRAVPPAEGARLLYERYHERIFGYCLYQLGSREEAEDAMQTTFLWAFRGLRRGVIPRAEDSWLFTIAKNACRARHRARGRKRQREVVSDPVVLEEMSSAPSRQHDELVGLEDALARMPDLQRRAILLREWQGLSYREIASELGLSGAAVETLIFRARRSLAELLNGKPAPKRARRFAFDFGSLGLALKTALGGASGAKLAAGLAAGVVLATTVAGSVQPSPSPAQTTVPAAPPAQPAPGDHPAQRDSLAVGKATTDEDRGSRRKKSMDEGKQAAPRTDDGQPPSSSLGRKIDDTVTVLPVAPVTDALPVDTATDLVDRTVQDVTEKVDDLTGTVGDLTAVLP